jgi:hypothetical protein
MDKNLISGGVSDEDVPSADEIAAEVERYLQGLDSPGDDPV